MTPINVRYWGYSGHRVIIRASSRLELKLHSNLSAKRNDSPATVAGNIENTPLT